MIEKTLAASNKGKGRQNGLEDEEDIEAAKTMAVTALVAMVEIWMSDLW